MSFFAKIFSGKSRKVHPGLSSKSSSSSGSRSSSSSRASRQRTRKARLHKEQSDVSQQMAKQYELVEELREKFNKISHDEAHKSKKDAARQRMVNAEKKARHLGDRATRLEDLAEVSVDIFSKIENMTDKSKEQQRALKKRYVALQKNFNSTLGKKAAIRSESAIQSSMKELDDFEKFINQY